MKPRKYQEDAINSIFNYFGQGNTGNPLIAMPTGTGKSIVIGGFIKRVYSQYPDQRIMMLTHVKELIEQNFEKLIKIWPAAPAGIYSAGVGRRDTHAKITFAGIQSVVNKHAVFGYIDLIIIDEAHLVSPRNNTSYKKFITALKETNPNLKVIGLSATPYRVGLGLLTEADTFSDICFDLTTMSAFNQLIEDGYLARLIPKQTKTQLDIDNVGLRGGEFINSELQEAVDKEAITHAAIVETIEEGHDRNHWLIFATGVEHAIHITNMLDSFGIPAAVIHGGMSKKNREQVLADYKAGLYTALVNNNVLTTGFDFPAIDLICMLRPTNSPGLWVQMLGRGTRPLYADGFNLEDLEQRLEAMRQGGKNDCLVLDFAGNTQRLGPINDPIIPKKKGAKKGGVAPVRLCDKCQKYNHASKRVCEYCGHEFPVSVKFGFRASTAALLATEEGPVVENYAVDRIVYSKHSKTGRPDAIKVSYFCGLRVFNNYVCLEHSGFASKKARNWWRLHTQQKSQMFLPDTTEQALAYVSNLIEPKILKVWVNKKYPEIMSYSFDGVNYVT